MSNFKRKRRRSIYPHRCPCKFWKFGLGGRKERMTARDYKAWVSAKEQMGGPA